MTHRLRSFAILAALVSLGLPASAQAQRPAEPTFAFDLPVSTLQDALARFRALTGWTVAADADELSGVKTTQAVRGTLTAAEALSRIVAGTGAEVAMTGPSAARVRLQVFTVSGVSVQAGRGYAPGATRTATKTETPLRDVPQAFSVITKEAIADQRMSGLDDLVRYVPGVTMGQGEGNRDQPTIRGNSGNGDLFVDGVRDDTEYFRDLYNVEQVEVPKGPNALIFGRGAGGGLINRVTKQATDAPVRAVMLETGMFGHKRAELDVGRGLTDGLAGRVTGMIESSDSYRRGYHLDRFGVTPTVKVDLGERTVLRAAYELFDDHRTADRGVPSFGGAPIATARSTFFGDPSNSWSDVRVHKGTATLERGLGKATLLRSHTHFADYKKMYQNVFAGAVSAAGSEVAITAYNNRIWRDNLFHQTDLTGTLATGPVKHTWLVGAELGRQWSDAFRNTGYFRDAAASVMVPVGTPTTEGIPLTFRQSATDADAHTTATAASGFVQDQIELTSHVQALVGARFDHFRLDYHNNRTNADLSRTDQVWSPRLGLILKPTTPLSVYGSYGVSFLPGSGAQFTSLNVTTQTLEPERFTNWEVGAKWEPAPDLSVTTAWYRLDRTNTSAPDPLDPTHTIQTGAQRSQGVEVSAAGRLAPGWQILLGYTHQHVEVTSRTNAAQPGQVPAMSPDYTASLWTRYQVTPRVGVGVGALRQDEMFAAIDDQVTLPAFTRLDCALFLDLHLRVRAQVNVENVLDAHYFSTANSNNNITPGRPREVEVSLTVR